MGVRQLARLHDTPAPCCRSRAEVLTHPVQRGLCQRAVAGKWSSARWYLHEPPRQPGADLPIIYGLWGREPSTSLPFPDDRHQGGLDPQDHRLFTERLRQQGSGVSWSRARGEVAIHHRGLSGFTLAEPVPPLRHAARTPPGPEMLPDGESGSAGTPAQGHRRRHTCGGGVALARPVGTQEDCGGEWA